MAVDPTVLYAGIIVMIVVLSVGAYLLIYQSMIEAYRDALTSLIAEYDKTASLYASLYAQYLSILKMYLNATIANGIIPSNVPPPPTMNMPQLPISVSITLPTQVTPPLTSWPPALPTTTT
jgi:hypothetical protein